MTSSTDTDLASPASDAVVRNPYRVLGLPGDSTWAEIRAAADRLLDDPEPEKRTTPWDLPWLGPVPRGSADVERALARLADSRRRLPDRLFWFHERFAESAVYELTPSTIRNAMEGWAATSQPVTRHDAAVVALIAAIALDPAVEKSAIWRRALEEWEEALQLEAYWLEVLRLEMEGGFEAPASLAEVREIREQGVRLVFEPLLAHAREAVVAEDLPRAARTLAVLREILSEEAFSSRCGELAEHVWGSFDAEWSPETRTKPPAPAAEPPREASIDTQNPALWDFAAQDDGAPAKPEAKPERPPEGATAGPEPSADTEPRETPKSAAAPGGEAFGVRPDPTTVGAGDGAGGVPRGGPEPAVRPETAVEPGAGARTEPAVEAKPAVEAEPAEAEPAARTTPAASASGAPRPDGPGEAPGRARLPHARSFLAAAVVLLVVVASASLVPRLRSGTEAGASPADSVLRTDVERRMETIDAALAGAFVDRAEIDEEIGLLRESVEGYQTLVDDYERRMARRLPADRRAYVRVVGLRDEARERLEAELADRRALEERIDRLERIGSGLIAEWNAVGRPGSETDRLPPP